MNKEKENSSREIFTIFEPSYSNLNRRQILGERVLFLGPEDTNNLISGVSTDGILPSKGGRFQKPEDLAGYALSGVPGINERDLVKMETGTLIVGNKFGGGSAREHAPRAL